MHGKSDEGYKSPPVGNEISATLYGIPTEIISDNDYLRRALLAALEADNFKTFGAVEHAFEPQGFSMIVGLNESHAAFHTYPEYNTIKFSLESCRGPTDGRTAYQSFRDAVKPISVDYHERRVHLKPKRKS